MSERPAGYYWVRLAFKLPGWVETSEWTPGHYLPDVWSAAFKWDGVLVEDVTGRHDERDPWVCEIGPAIEPPADPRGAA